MRSTITAAAVLAALTFVSACGDNDAGSQTQTTEPDAAPRVDADPTPQTGTGGDQQGSQPAEPGEAPQTAPSSTP